MGGIEDRLWNAQRFGKLELININNKAFSRNDHFLKSESVAPSTVEAKAKFQTDDNVGVLFVLLPQRNVALPTDAVMEQLQHHMLQYNNKAAW